MLDRLRADGELDDALVVFLSDHGEMLGERRHHFSKYCLYEGSVRVPLILSGPRVPEGLRGTVDSRPAELVDVLPTLPGGSLFAPPCRRGAFCEMHGSGYAETERAPALLWRTAEWKLILYLPGELAGAKRRVGDCGGELYHLGDDPQEWHNRWDDPACRDLRERMTRELLMHVACAASRSASRCRLEP